MLEKFFDLRPLTSVQIVRLYTQAYNRMKRGAGYQPFGFDWTTLHLTHPEIYDILQSCRLEILRRQHS